MWLAGAGAKPFVGTLAEIGKTSAASIPSTPRNVKTTVADGAGNYALITHCRSEAIHGTPRFIAKQSSCTQKGAVERAARIHRKRTGSAPGLIAPAIRLATGALALI